MRVLLVEPDYRRSSASFRARQLSEGIKKQDDERLWYPPLGLMKLSTFHKRRGDNVHFVSGCDSSLFSNEDIFSAPKLWDRVYITTLFTFDWNNIVKTINFYKEAAGGSTHKIMVGGIMATLMAEELFEETGIYPIKGVITKPDQIGLDGSDDIDLLPPDYSVLDPRLYAINDTYYGYSTRGCTQSCPWCGVPKIEPEYRSYIDIKPAINNLINAEPKEIYGEKSKLKLMDNNILASPYLEKIIDDLVSLKFGRDDFTKSHPKKKKVVDFNQGLDATHVTEENLKILQRININPMRIAFDRIQEKDQYVKALRLSKEYGFKVFSNYMLYGWKDTPRDLYERIVVNLNLNADWKRDNGGKPAVIYSYPMRFAPIFDLEGTGENRSRDRDYDTNDNISDFLQNAIWNKRFVRNIEVIKGAAHGAISPTPDYAWRAIGHSYEEFIANLYMPEELLRNRNKHETRIYPYDPDREPGTGKLEEFRDFIYKNAKNPTDDFMAFHRIISSNLTPDIRKGQKELTNPEMLDWLQYYLKKD
jgi:hypothetical protein